LPAAVLVSISCSVALREAPQPSQPDNVLQVSNAPGQPVDAGHHQDVALTEEIQEVRSSSRPAVVVPLRFSDQMISQRAARRAFSCSSRFWSVVLTRAKRYGHVGSSSVACRLKTE
jgi:hypothetical protein